MLFAAVKLLLLPSALGLVRFPPVQVVLIEDGCSFSSHSKCSVSLWEYDFSHLITCTMHMGIKVNMYVFSCGCVLCELSNLQKVPKELRFCEDDPTALSSDPTSDAYIDQVSHRTVNTHENNFFLFNFGKPSQR